MNLSQVAESALIGPSGKGPDPAPLSCALGLQAPFITEVVMFNYGRLLPNNQTQPHLHTFHQIDVVLQGRVRHDVEGLGSRELTVGDGLLIAPLARHESRSSSGFVHVSFKLFLAPQITRRLGSRSCRFRVPEPLVQLLDWTGQRMARHESDAPQGVLAVATLVILETLRDSPAVQPGEAPPLDDFRRLVLPVLQPVDENPSAEWTVEAMARQCNLSVDYFTRCFRRALRQTPKQYLLAARMRRAAAELLATPPLAIKHVARRLGYSSVQTFSRAFREAIGVSPAAFRKDPLAGHGPSPYL